MKFLAKEHGRLSVVCICEAVFCVASVLYSVPVAAGLPVSGAGVCLDLGGLMKNKR